MATTPLILDAGVITVATVDFSDAITSATIQATADEVEIPQTMGTAKTSRRGAVKYELVLKYLANDTSLTAELFEVLFGAISDPTGSGELAVTVQMRTGSPSATNPQWTGTISVLSAMVGGDIGGLSEGSGTFPFTGKPTRATS